MRSPTARLILAALACLATAGAAFYVFQLEGPLAERRAGMSAFDRTARSVMLSLEGARAAQLAYVAEGQGTAIWQPSVAAALAEAPAEIDALRALSGAVDARSRLIEATARLRTFAEIDRRALEYLETGDTLMASDLVFAEGAQAMAAAIELVDAAWRLEVAQLASLEDAHRRTLAAVAGAAAGGLVLVLALLTIPAAPRARAQQRPARARDAAQGFDLRLRDSEPAAAEASQGGAASAPPSPARSQSAPEPPGAAAAESPDPPPVLTPATHHEADLVSLLRSAADICVSLGAVRDAGALRELLARAAGLMDTPGLIVWLGDAGGHHLVASVGHGYSQPALSRMPAIARGAGNAVAAAWRSSSLQVVPSGHGTPGAVIAPLVTPAGCVGALSAEVAAGRESSDAIHALALLFAAQLSALLGAEVPDDKAAEARAASA